MKYDPRDLTDKQLKDLHKGLLTPRLIEEKMLLLLRQGKISKWFSGIGQEAISVGCTAALSVEEKVFSMHRNLGVFTQRAVPMRRLFSQWQGKASGFTKGRDRSFHFGAPEYNIVGMISHLGPQLSLAAGVGLGYKLEGKPQVSLAFTGEGGTSQGEFHEALNTASVWKIPAIFVIENNGYGLSTPTSEQYACDTLADRAKGYGMKSRIIDGNNILEVYHTIRDIKESMIADPQPWLIECRTFRMRGHEEASGTKYVPKELFDTWEKKDPIYNFEKFLLKENVVDQDYFDALRKDIKAEISREWDAADKEPVISSNIARETADVFAQPQHSVDFAPSSTTKEMRFVDAIKDGLDQVMARHENTVLMGQDIADYGGVFKITDGFKEKYGGDRVRNTPLCESAILGIGIGLSMEGYKPMVEMQFADFVTCGFNQIVNNAAKLHYRWGQNVDMVVRMPTGGGVGAGPFHSQSNEAWFYHTPGIKIVYPSNPVDAKGLVISAFEDPNPVMVFEHKKMYRMLSADVPEGYYTTPIGKAVVNREGADISVITYGMGVHWANALADQIDVDVEIIDLRSLQPIDYDTVSASVRKTGKAIVLHEDNLQGGIGGDLASYIGEHLFEFLDGPVLRVASLDTPIPFAKEIENIYMADSRLQEAVEKLMAY